MCALVQDEPTGFIKYSKFEPLMLDILLTDEYRPTPKDGKEMPSELMVRNSEDLILQVWLTSRPNALPHRATAIDTGTFPR